MKEVKAIVLAGDYGVRIMNVERDEEGKIRLVEPDDHVWVNSCYSDDPPQVEQNVDYDEEGNMICAECGSKLSDIEWIPVD